jgi:DNA-binding transcriptional ArsR family regulator
MRRDVFQAIADPTRREIMMLLAKSPRNLNAIASHFDISRPAISQQIRILEECGLITIDASGRERICTARINKLRDVTLWIERCHTYWNARLDALEQYLDHAPPVSKKKSNTPKKKSKRS